MTRVLWIAGIEPNKLGGFERMCAELARLGRSRGVDVHFVFECGPCPELAARLTDAGATVHVIPRVGLPTLGHSLVLGALLLRLRPRVMHLHFFELFGTFSLIAWILRVPVVATYHYSGDTRPRPGLRRWLKQLRQMLFGRVVTAITAVSESARDKIAGDYMVSRDRVRVIYNGTDVGTTPEWREAAVGPRLAFVGNLSREKGAHIAIEALAILADRLPDARLTVIGDGREGGNLRHLAAARTLDRRVSFLGMRSDVGALLRAHDMLLVPSIWKEAFGFVIIEAMAAGCPAVASEVGGIPEIIADGIDGLLVPPDDPAALAAAVARLWDDPILRRSLVDNARTKVAGRFALDQIVREYWDIYPAL